MLAVVVTDVEVENEYEFTRQRFGSNPEQLRLLSEWLIEGQVEEVVMESTAQYWQPVWGALERYWKPRCQKRTGVGPMSGSLHLAQAHSNRGRRGRKKDFPDAERLVKRLVAQELTLSFVPDAEQRLWRTVTRRKHQLTRNRVQLHNRLESYQSGPNLDTKKGRLIISTSLSTKRTQGRADEFIHLNKCFECWRSAIGSGFIISPTVLNRIRDIEE